MTRQYSIDENATRSRSRAISARDHLTKRPALRRSMKTGALCALFCLASSVLVAPTEVSAAPFGSDPFPPGSVVVAQGGTIAGDGTGTRDRSRQMGTLNVYPPDANGDVAPEASFTQGMNGPFVVVFDPSGDLWVANVNNTSDSTIVEITRAELGTPNPVPAVTISAPSRRMRSTTPTAWLSTAGATCGSSVTSWAWSTSTQAGNWPSRARRRPSPQSQTYRPPRMATVLTPGATCG